MILSCHVNLEPFISFTRELAAASADVILPLYSTREVGLELKADETPVTFADRRAEEVMRQLIEKRFPSHGIVGEELGTTRGDAEFVWVLDPIDGTKSFITNVPLFGTLIGLLHQGKPIVGCIHQPVLKQLVIGDGRTTTLNGSPVHVRPCSDISQATLLTCDPINPERHQDGAAFDRLAKKARIYRTWGDCYGYLLVATGWADLMVDPILNPWDLLPLVPVIRGAGGIITDWQGKPADHLGANSAVACAPELHAQVIAALNGGK